MRIIGLVNGKLKYTTDVQWPVADWNWCLKRLFLDWQTQEIFIQYRNKSGWVAVDYVMQVTSSGMHPSKVDWSSRKLQNSDMPEEIQMKLLMGAL